MRLHSLLFCLLVAAVASFASAQSTEPDRDAARRSFDRGMHHYNLGEFDLALRHFKAAYDVSPHAELLFDIGQCHRNLGHYENAIFFFERYVEERPEAQDEVKALLVELRDTRYVVYDPPPLTATVSKSGYHLELPTPRLVEERPLLEQWWFWAAVMGAAAVAAGTVVLVATLTDSPDQRPREPVAVFNPDF